MGREDKEDKVKWLLSGELEQPGSKSIVPGRHCHIALGSFASSPPESRHSAGLCQFDGQACLRPGVTSLLGLSGA